MNSKMVFGGELRANSESRTIEGKAISFDTESNYIGFIEVLHRGCITQELIDKSNIVFTYNHKREQILARRKNGEGNLDIQLRDDGVYFSFEAPNTTLGNDVLENIRCGNIMQCSFAFDYGINKDSIKRSFNDGVKRIDVYEIGALYDLSVVVDPAYEDTYVKTRSAELDEEEVKDEDEKKDEQTEETNTEETNVNESNTDEQTDDEDKKEERKTEINNIKDTCNDTGEKIQKYTQNTIMEKRFSLVNAINDIANNRSVDEITSAVLNDGVAEARKSGLSYGGQIQLPVSELRANLTVAAEGADVVATEIYDVMGPLRAKNVLVQAGAKFLTGLVGDVQIPLMSASNVYFGSETGTAQDGAGAFTHVTLTPHRLTAYVNISKQFLTQTSQDVENMIRQDIVNAINAKLEDVILGSGDGKEGGSTVVAPIGMFNGKTTVKSVTTMAKVAEMEATVEAANVLGDCKWIVSPTFKATLRDKAKGSNVAQSLYANGEIDGTPALSTGHVGANLAVYGDWSNVAIGQWGSIDITVDPYTQAKNGMIVLVVNCYFDAKVLRDNAFVYGTTAAS